MWNSSQSLGSAVVVALVVVRLVVVVGLVVVGVVVGLVVVLLVVGLLDVDVFLVVVSGPKESLSLTWTINSPYLEAKDRCLYPAVEVHWYSLHN